MPRFCSGRGGVDQPHQQEEGHHRGHEVGIGDFPGAAVMAAMPALLDALDDDRVVAGHDPATQFTRLGRPVFSPGWLA